MKKAIIALILTTVFFTTGCELNILYEQISRDPEFRESIIKQISDKKADEAFRVVQSLLKANNYNSVDMNDIALSFIEANNCEEGLYILQILHDKYPQNDSIRHNLASGYNAIGKYKLADYYSDLALENESNDSIEYVNKGDALLGLNQYEAALKVYEQAYLADQSLGTALWGMARTYFEMERYEEAIRYFEMFNKTVPADADDSSYYLSTSLKELKRFDEAIKFYEVQYNEDKTDTSPLYSIASIYQDDLKNSEKALEYSQKIIDLDPKEGWAYLNMADYLAQNKKYEDAVRHIGKAIELDDELYYELYYYDSFENLKNLESYKQLFR